MQEKCFLAIQDAVGTGRLPTLQDKLRLPYVEATAMEILRKANIVPFGVHHTVSEDVVFHGYLIPRNAVILPFMESVLSDPQIWTDPEDFRPERFLNDDGKCVRPDEFIPFSLGECTFACINRPILEKKRREKILLVLSCRESYSPQSPDKHGNGYTHSEGIAVLFDSKRSHC